MKSAKKHWKQATENAKTDRNRRGKHLLWLRWHRDFATKNYVTCHKPVDPAKHVTAKHSNATRRPSESSGLKHKNPQKWLVKTWTMPGLGWSKFIFQFMYSDKHVRNAPHFVWMYRTKHFERGVAILKLSTRRAILKPWNSRQVYTYIYARHFNTNHMWLKATTGEQKTWVGSSREDSPLSSSSQAPFRF